MYNIYKTKCTVWKVFYSSNSIWGHIPSVIKQKGESQNKCYMKKKHAKFSENEHFLSPDTYKHIFWDSPFYIITDDISWVTNKHHWYYSHKNQIIHWINGNNNKSKACLTKFMPNEATEKSIQAAYRQHCLKMPKIIHLIHKIAIHFYTKREWLKRTNYKITKKIQNRIRETIALPLHKDYQKCWISEWQKTQTRD